MPSLLSFDARLLTNVARRRALDGRKECESGRSKNKQTRDAWDIDRILEVFLFVIHLVVVSLRQEVEGGAIVIVGG